MAISLAAHKEHKEANLKLPSKEFIKKYKWWLVGGLAIGLVAFLYFKNKSGSSSSNGTTSATSGTAAVDPNTGVPYATELAQAQQAAAAGSGSSGTTSDGSSGSSSDGSTGSSSTGTSSTGSSGTSGTPSTSPTTTPSTTPATTSPNPVTTLPRHTTVKKPAPVKTTQPVSKLPAAKRMGFPYPPAKGTVTV